MTSPTAFPRQTLSYLRNLFAERGLKPKNKLGQNFLIDLNLLDLLIRTAELGPEDFVLEIGSGTGSLTARLAESAGAVFSVEIDPAFYSLASETAAGRENVRLLHADILKNKNQLNPEILAALADFRTRSGASRFKLVANLPYAVATPVIANFLIIDADLERLVVMVQWEMAERLTARPGIKDYNALSVLVQSLADVEIVRQLPPAAFWPRPQVASAIVRIRPDKKKRVRVGDVAQFRNFLRELYVHRRKNLRGALAGLPSGRIAKEEVDRKLEELGLPGTARSETLDVEQHLVLCAAFGSEPLRKRGQTP
jgi:16S rRNA (adenine1518-N6/adenine1519-N6)-dimethyltransferase